MYRPRSPPPLAGEGGEGEAPSPTPAHLSPPARLARIPPPQASRKRGRGRKTNASRRQILPQRLPRIRGAQAAAALQFGHQQVDDVMQCLDLLGLRMAQHESAAAARALEALLQLVGDLRGRVG